MQMSLLLGGRSFGRPIVTFSRGLCLFRPRKGLTSSSSTLAVFVQGEYLWLVVWKIRVEVERIALKKVPIRSRQGYASIEEAYRERVFFY